MKQRLDELAKAIFERPATRLAHRIIVCTPEIFDPVLEHAERFAERSQQTSDLTAKLIHRHRYLQDAPILLESRTTGLFDALPAIGWGVRRLLQFADWHSIAETLYTSALGYRKHADSFLEHDAE